MVGDGELGHRLREARKARGLSLRTVAAQAGVSPSLLSQVENGKTQPSVSTLYSIVSCLELSVDKLLGNTPGKDAASGGAPAGGGGSVVQRREDAPRIEMQNGVTWERMAVAGFTDVDPLHTIYAPGGASSVDGRFMRHSGVEYGYLIEGELTLKLEFESYTLRAGDSLCFDSQRPHLYVNESGAMCRGMWVVVDRVAEMEVPTEGPLVAEGREINSAVDVLDALHSR